ncbi:MAG TPA: hypothetical protein ENN07_06310 [candidate division Zixibacteria bacterium]|nr:hypothetical protein [candidate division Zixibacteria bacterium]
MKAKITICIIALALVFSIALAKMPALELDGSIFEGKTTYTYGLFDIKTGEEVAKTVVIVEVEDGMLLIDDSLNESFVSVKLPGLEPYYGEKTIRYEGEYVIHSQFEGDSIIVDATTPAGDQHIRLKIPRQPMLHNDQLLFSLPAMDFSAERQRFSLFVPANASFIDAAVIIEGTETVEVPAGEFEIYKVKFDFGTTVQEGYYAVEAPHHLIIYDNGALQYRLEEITAE